MDDIASNHVRSSLMNPNYYLPFCLGADELGWCASGCVGIALRAWSRRRLDVSLNKDEDAYP
jgi:hypothetical protein